MSNNAPAIRENKDVIISDGDFNKLQFIAKTAMASGLYNGIGGESKIFMILLMAHELGISPMIALNKGIHNINGTVEISPRLMNSMIRQRGHQIKSIHSDALKCTLMGKRVDTGETETITFTMEDAQKAGLTKNPSWSKYPEDMLYARTMSRLARRLFSDVIGTAYVEGEISGVEVLSDSSVRIQVCDVEVSECQAALHVEKEEPKEPISHEQYRQIMSYVDVNDKEDQAYLARVCSHFRISSISQLPAHQFDSVIKRIRLYSEEKKQNKPLMIEEVKQESAPSVFEGE